MCVCVFFHLFTQAGFSGSYAADMGLRPTAGFLVLGQEVYPHTQAVTMKTRVTREIFAQMSRILKIYKRWMRRKDNAKRQDLRKKLPRRYK